MHRRLLLVFLATMALTLSLSAVAVGGGAPQPRGGAPARPAGQVDRLPNPLAARRAALRLRAVEQRARGAVYQAAPGEFVELTVDGPGMVWALAAEFGNTAAPDYGGAPGPRHNQIPEPDRAVDNTTIWRANFNPAYYEALLFSDAPGALSLRNYYLEQSSGRFALAGDVAGWERVPFNAARYGSNLCGAIVCPTVWDFVQDSIDAWYAGRQAAGLSAAAINGYLAQFDGWDRYDYDGDGDFDEPDGYIDRFHSIFAGVNDASGFGEGISGHGWYAFYDDPTAGPPFNMAGGARIGASNYWVGDYMMTAENGGLGSIAYLTATDMGLPPLYDSGFIGNSTGFWTLMGLGHLGHDGVNGIGGKPIGLGPWEKLQLGWLDYAEAFAGTQSNHRLGPANAAGEYPQALLVHLPDKVITIDNGAPYAGEYFYMSDDGDNVDNRLYREFDLPAGSELTARVNYLLEPDWDYAYLIASSDGGATWTNVATNLSTGDNPNGQNFGNGITGDSGGAWVELTADLSAFTGPTLIGFRHWTDFFTTPDQQGPFRIDEIAVTGYPVDGAESEAGWTFEPAGGFRAVKGQETFTYFHAYLAEYRQYRGFDEALRTGPYTLISPSLVRSFPYQDGLLIWYWDGSQTDNNVSFHQGRGLILPIDARPQLMTFDENGYWSPAVQAYDATFGRGRTDAIVLHDSEGQAHRIPSRWVSPVFDDNKQYWDPALPGFGSVQHPHTGTKIRVLTMPGNGRLMRVQVRPTP